MASLKKNLALFLLPVFFIVASCDDTGGGLTTSVPNIDGWAVGPGDSSRPDQFQGVPDGDQLALNFGLVDVRTTKYLYLFFHNGGKSNLKLYRVEWAQGSSSDFSVACRVAGVYQPCPTGSGEVIETEPGADQVLRVAYVPQELGPDSGSFVVDSNSDQHKRITVQVSGEGATLLKVCISDCTGDQNDAACASAPEICSDQVAPEHLSMKFGDTELTSPKHRRVTIINQWDQPLHITDLRFGTGDFNQFRLDKKGNQLPGVMEPGARAEIEVGYAPGTGGEHNSSLRVVSSDISSGEVVVDLSGRALAPRVCPDPLFVDFGNVPTGETSVKSFKITNCGLLELNLMDLSLSQGTSEDFTFHNKPSLPRTLQVNESVDVEIQYAPKQAGSDAGGVDIFSNDPTADPNSHYTGTVSLAGRSVPRICDIQVTPFAVMFGGVVKNTTDTVDLIVSNQGSDTCILNDATITQNSADNEFAISEKPSPNTSINPGDTLLIKVSYSPKNLGVDTGVLTIYGNDKDGNEIKVDLNGQGVEDSVCDLSITPTSYQYGMVKVNNTKTTTITLKNRGQQPCTVNRLDLKKSFTTPGDISITKATPVPFQLDRSGTPNSTVAIEVTLAPTHIGTHKAYLFLGSNDPDLQLGGFDCIYANGGPIPLGSACVPLTGSADEGTIEAVPSELDFGMVTVGCASPELQVTLYNLGGISINISRIYLDNPAGPFKIRSAPSTPYELRGGASVQLKLRYVPTANQTDRGTLYVECDASNTQLLAIPLYGRGTNITDQTDVFHQPSQVKSDILFVVDNSGSMSEEQNALTSNFTSFINYAITLNVSFQIGVVATEVNDPESGIGSPKRDVFPGVLVQAPNRPKIITNTTPDIANAFKDNATLGTCCSDEQEAGLQAAWMALSPPNIDDPAKNAGFLREDAKLYIIILSDEQDQSKGKPDFYIDFFKSIKGYRNRERMKVSVIVGDDPDGCGNGQAESGSRYIEVANQTGGMFISICNGNWAQSLQSLGIDAFAAIREFPLSRQADPNTITVTVDGQSVPKSSSTDCETCTTGWVYYQDTNTICFCSGSVPGRGARIDVHYTAVCITP